MKIVDKKGNEWEVHAITDSYYHIHDEMGNIDFVNHRGIQVDFKRIKE